MTLESKFELTSYELKDLNLMAQKLAEHNAAYGVGARFGKSLAAGLLARVSDGEQSLDSAMRNAANESVSDGNVGITALRAKFGEVAKAYGIRFEEKPGLDDSAPIGEVMVVIDHPSVFLDRIESLISKITDENQAIFLKAVVKDFSIFIKTEEGKQDEHLLSRLDEVVQMLEPLSENQLLDVRVLREVSKHHRSGELEGYLEAEEAGLWNKPGVGFGPGDWVRDITADLLDEQWSKAVTVLERQKPQGSVYNDLQSHLLECIVHSDGLLDSMEYLTPEQREEFRNILKKYTPRLVGNLSA